MGDLKTGGLDMQVELEQAAKIVLTEGGRIPTRAHDGDAGYDLYASESVYVFPRSCVDIHTGVYLSLPAGVWCQIMPRSSTSRWHGLHVLSAVIDNGYRGEVFIQVNNPNDGVVRVEKDTRLAQLIPHRLIDLQFHVVDFLQETERGTSGFGSSGV